jgi:hypothetical protein
VGNVKVEGYISAVNVSGSDIRYKRDIVSLNGSGALNSVLQMRPVEYYLKQQYSKPAGDTAKADIPLYPEDSPLMTKKQYGLIAQEIQKLYPDLVYEEGNGYLAVNYTGLIPILIESIKELKAEVDGLKAGKQAVKSSIAGIAAAAAPAAECLLFQNVPNPFNQNTEISFYLPESVQAAKLCIYNMQGSQLRQIPLQQRGSGSQTISASEFSAGMYLYALIADGQEVDVKRMILTE